MTWLAERRREPEVMDDPRLDATRHVAALDALGRINRVSGTSGRVLREVLRTARRRPGPVRILDVACGDGRVLAQVSASAGRRGIRVDAHGCDLSDTALSRAAEVAASMGSEMTLSRVDVTREPLPGSFDLVVCSLFLHHLSDEDAVGLMVAMRRAGDVVLLQDLRRTRLGLVLAWTGVRLLTRSDVARVDGPRSVRAAFTLNEVRRLSARAGMSDVRIRPSWPQRFTLRWERSA